jgi:hypothetical protein
MELFRFRIVRPVLSQPCDGLDVRGMFDPPLDAEELRKAAIEFAAQGSVITPQEIAGWLAGFSTALALRGDLVSPKDCLSLLPGDWLAEVRSQAWIQLGQQFALGLAAAMQKDPQEPGVIESWCRSLLVRDLVAALAAEQAQHPNQDSPKTAADVRALVSWRHVILPLSYFPNVSGTPVLARRPGVTDFYVVQDEWDHYQAGELAAVINVLPGETFENRIRHSQKVDTLTSTTTETTTSQTTEQDQTMSTSLSESSSNDASMNIGVEGQVQVSGQYGLAHISTSLGAQMQTSQSQSDSKAFTTAYQTVQRAVKSVTQTVTSIQSQRTVTLDSTYDDHKLQNTGKDVTVGMYRWLTEIHYAQLVRYPNRLTLEFEVPEPGAWLRWALQNVPTTNWDNPDPGPFVVAGTAGLLNPSMIGAKILPSIAAQWRIQGLTPSPPAYLTVSMKLTGDPTQQVDVGLAADASLTVPNGYIATSWSAQVVARIDPSTSTTAGGQGSSAAATTPDPAAAVADVAVTVGGSQKSLQWATSKDSYDVSPDGSSISAYLTGQVGDPTAAGGSGGVNTGTIPVTVYSYDKFVGFSCVLNVTCELMAEAYQQWQEKTFDQVAAAYQALLDAYHLERDTRMQQVGALADLAGPPELNQARAVTELRRSVIQDLLGQQLPLNDDVQTYGNGEPYVPVGPLPDTDMIQFFEQVLEWENLVYICYPYYWGRRGTNGALWVANAISASSDPVFDQFLNAGSARVVVPARPGFENLVLFYLFTGQVWGGSQPPAPDDPDYLSVAQEIQALQKGADDATPISPSWEVALPTTLLWAGSDVATLPSNSAQTIPKPPVGTAGVSASTVDS